MSDEFTNIDPHGTVNSRSTMLHCGRIVL